MTALAFVVGVGLGVVLGRYQRPAPVPPSNVIDLTAAIERRRGRR